VQVEADIVAALDSGALKDRPDRLREPGQCGGVYTRAVAAFVTRQIQAFECGEPLADVVNPRRGY
jgi:hypothetical protein